MATSPDPFLMEISLLKERVPSFDEYPYSIPAIAQLDRLKFHPRVTFFIGENGSGKSTLLEAIAVLEGLNPEGGSRNFNFSTAATHSKLAEALRPLRGARRLKDADSFFLRAESFYNVSSEVDQLRKHGGDETLFMANYGGKSLHKRSHGESFLALLENRFWGNGLYLLDEPESALSPIRQMSLLAIVHRLVRGGSQFIIATHSPIIMGYPDATIYQLSERGISKADYHDTEHFKVTSAFLARRDQMLRELFKEDEAGEAAPAES